MLGLRPALCLFELRINQFDMRLAGRSPVIQAPARKGHFAKRLCLWQAEPWFCFAKEGLKAQWAGTRPDQSHRNDLYYSIVKSAMTGLEPIIHHPSENKF